MRIVRYMHEGVTSYGDLQGDKIVPLQGELAQLAPIKGSAQVALSAVKLLAPVTPSKIIAIGPGYKAFVQGDFKLERPNYWLKPSTSIQDPDGDIVLPPKLTVNHEAEIAIVIGSRAKDVAFADARNYILGYTICHDATAGDMSSAAAFMGSQLYLDGKIFDTFCPIGPAIVTDLDPSDLRIQCRVNGKVRQDHRTSDRLYDYPMLVSMISHVLTLLPGDVITTGSIPGVAPFVAGDTIEIEIEGIGVLRNRAVAGK